MNFDLNTFLLVIPRGMISLITLFFTTKLLGKKQISELSLFDYVMGISIGNFAAEITINKEVSIMNGVFAVLMFGVIAFIISKLTVKSIWVRRFVTGIPAVLVENGEFIVENMKKNNFDINDFLQEARSSGYFNITDIDYAILEVNGKVSFLPKPENQPATKKDVNVKSMKEGLCANVIIDGNYMEQNMKDANIEKEWLEHELKVKGYKDIKNLLLVTVNQLKQVEVFEKKHIKAANILE
jgi:uncharacterized membrane protein YcaP (DUF421 family)